MAPSPICVRSTLSAIVVALLLSGAHPVAAGEFLKSEGTIIARILGPSSPTPQTEIRNEGFFWVSLAVSEVREGFAVELKGRTIKLQTANFDPSLIGKSIPLRLLRDPKRSFGADYRLLCTHLGIAHEIARSMPK